MNVYGAYSVVAFVSASASFLLGFSVIKTLIDISNSGMWAIAVMVMAPGAMGIAVSFFICLSHRAQPREPERRRPPDDFDTETFVAKDR
jgi:hypothetical protein